MISILTPTYNRGYILHNAYQSLCNQSIFDFEWIIVDDGSMDNTEKLVESWKKECNAFPIIYRKQENGGKHRAINKGVSYVHAEYVLILDSDDFLEENAVELIHKWVASIKDLNGFAGVSGLRGWINKEGAIGGKINKEYIDATQLERRRYGLMGDKAEVYKTEILKKYPFPEFEGEKFLSESAVWDRIAKDGYKIRWFNTIIYRCEYLEDGLTNNTNSKVYVENFNGFTYCTKLNISTQSFFYKYLRIGYYISIAKLKKMHHRKICEVLGIKRIQILVGVIFYKSNCIRKNLFRKKKG